MHRPSRGAPYARALALTKRAANSLLWETLTRQNCVMAKKDTQTLTLRQQRFVDEYIIDLNGKQAAIRAGYSAKTAEQQASVLLGYPKVAASLLQAQADRAKRTRIKADQVLSELARIGFADIRRVVTWRTIPQEEGSEAAGTVVTLVDSDQVDDDAAQAIAEVRQTAGGIRLKMHDKLRALELLGKHLGMFTDKVQHSVTPDLAELLKVRRERARNAGR